jgi:hypothetical protein
MAGERHAPKIKDVIATKWKQVLLAVFIFWGAISFFVFFAFDSWESRGQFGDMFGTVNALFSGFAFAGVLIAILLQRDELALQREELKMTRQELRRSAEAQEKSEEALRRQATSLKVAARLNAAITLLDHYKAEIERINLTGFSGGSHKEKMYNEATQEKERLLKEIEAIFDEKA